MATDAMPEVLQAMAMKWKDLDEKWETQLGFLLWHTYERRRAALEAVELRAFQQLGLSIKKCVEDEIEIEEYDEHGVEEDADLEAFEWPGGESVNWIVDGMGNMDLIRGCCDELDVHLQIKTSPAMSVCAEILDMCIKAKVDVNSTGDPDGEFWKDKLPYSLDSGWFRWNDEKHEAYEAYEGFTKHKESIEA